MKATLGIGLGKTFVSELRDNSGDLYHVSISKEVSPAQIKSIIDYVNKYPKQYNLNSYACADFGIKIGNLGGIPLKSTTVEYVLFRGVVEFRGRTPAYLGQEIRTMKETKELKIEKRKGNLPKSSKNNCK
ncbi:MAG: hypothetical protein AAFX53_12720 [Bacteroidota bacterium]